MDSNQRFRIAIAIVIVLGFSGCKEQNPPPENNKPQDHTNEAELHDEVVRKAQSTTGKYYYEVSARMTRPSLPLQKRDVHSCQLTIYEASNSKILKQYKSDSKDIPCEMTDFFYANGWVDDDTISMETPAIGAADAQYTLFHLNWHSNEKKKIGWVTESPYGPGLVGGVAFALIEDRRFLVQYNKSKDVFQIFEHKTRANEGTIDFFSEKDQTVDAQKALEVASFAADRTAEHSVNIDSGHLIIKVGDEIISYNIQTKTLDRK